MIVVVRGATQCSTWFQCSQQEEQASLFGGILGLETAEDKSTIFQNRQSRNNAVVTGLCLAHLFIIKSDMICRYNVRMEPSIKGERLECTWKLRVGLPTAHFSPLNRYLQPWRDFGKCFAWPLLQIFCENQTEYQLSVDLLIVSDMWHTVHVEVNHKKNK